MDCHIRRKNIKDYIGIDTIIFDAKKNTVLPGFIDSHFHMVQTALNSISLDLSGTKNHEEIGRLISEEAKANPGKHIRGIRLDAEKLEEKCFPGRNFLDKFCNDVPVWINSSEYQVSVLNTYAMLYFKIPLLLFKNFNTFSVCVIALPPFVYIISHTNSSNKY